MFWTFVHRYHFRFSTSLCNFFSLVYLINTDLFHADVDYNRWCYNYNYEFISAKPKSTCVRTNKSWTKPFSAIFCNFKHKFGTNEERKGWLWMRWLKCYFIIALFNTSSFIQRCLLTNSNNVSLRENMRGYQISLSKLLSENCFKEYAPIIFSWRKLFVLLDIDDDVMFSIFHFNLYPAATQRQAQIFSLLLHTWLPYRKLNSQQFSFQFDLGDGNFRVLISSLRDTNENNFSIRKQWDWMVTWFLMIVSCM